EAFPSNRPDDTLREGILPGRSWGYEDLANPHAFHLPCEQVTVDGIPIAEQVGGRCLCREALDKLLGGPGGCWVVGDGDLDEFSTVVSQDQEPEEQAKGEGGDDEEVDGDDVADMRLKEGAPRRGWPRRGAPHVLGNGEPGDLIAEEPEFGLDPASTPGRVLSGHAAEQRADLELERRAARGSRCSLPAPSTVEAGAGARVAATG